MDEVGRGTSNVDGICLSRAILEYIHNKIDARCLFATHYNELTELEKYFPKISNYFAESILEDDGIVFTHKILKGKSNDSYGIEVAKISGINSDIIARAKEIKESLNASSLNPK
jgi:DNA mismatch repair protein MutS